MEKITIRQAKDDDIGEIKDIIRAAFDRPGKDKYFNEWEKDILNYIYFEVMRDDINI